MPSLSVPHDVRDFVSLSAALKLIGSSPVTLKISVKVYLAQSILIPENVALLFDRAGRLVVSEGVTLNIRGAIDAGLWQIFDGKGHIDLTWSKTPGIYPHWFGATGTFNPDANPDLSTDDAPAFQKALQSISRAQTLRVPLGCYKLKSSLITPEQVTILGEGLGSVLWGELSDPNGTLLHLGPTDPTGPGASETLVRDLSIVGGGSPGRNAIAARSMCRCVLDNLHVSGHYQYILQVSRQSEGITPEEGGGIECSEINLTMAFPCTFYPFQYRVPFPVHGVYNRGWSNAVKYRLHFSSLSGIGIHLDGTFGSGNNCSIEGSLQGIQGQAVLVKNGTKTSLTNLHCEANVQDIKLINLSKPSIGPNVCGNVTLESCWGASIQQHSGELVIDAQCRGTLVLAGADNDNTSLINHSLSTMTIGENPVFVNGASAFTAGFSIGDHQNLILNGDMSRWLEGMGSEQLWGFGGWYVGTRCGTGQADTTRTRNAPFCARLQEREGWGSVAECLLMEGSTLPETMAGQLLVISAKVKAVKGDAYIHATHRGESDWGWGQLVRQFSIPVENGFSLFTCAFRVTAAMCQHGAVVRVAFPNGAIIYLSELMAVFGTASPRDFVRRTETIDGQHALRNGLLISYAPAMPTDQGDPVFSRPAQRGDMIYNSVPEERGGVGQKYTELGWRCVAPGVPGTWVPMRLPTGN